MQSFSHLSGSITSLAPSPLWIHHLSGSITSLAPSPLWIHHLSGSITSLASPHSLHLTSLLIFSLPPYPSLL
ncbi:hypothetical protein CLOM_g17806 [Closterium sp. NIES-68]|nr:hypothetical protein CLOM_g17806 [Closterium sp. NIES-68]